MAADEISKAAGHPIARVLPLLSPAHLDRDFDYLVPAELDEIARPGVRVRVRFAGRLVDGYLLERLPRSDHNGKMMPLERVVSPERVLAPEILRLATAVATRYAGTRADVLRLAIPPRHARTETGGTKKPGTAAKAPPVTEVVDTEDDSPSDIPAEADGNGSGESAAAAGGATADQPDETTAEVRPESTPEVPVAQSRVEVDASAWGRYVHGLAFVDALAHGKGARAAWQALPGENWAARLAELAATVAASGRSAVLMVPDQRDLDRLLAECVALVGDSAVGLSAGLGPAARYRRWLAVLRGQARIVVGTRAAVFAPARDLGLIAIWDDGDDTYAEPRSPYPHAREVAMLRAHETGAAFVAAGFARTAEIQAVVESGWARDLLAERQVLREVTPRISAPGDSDFALERDALARSVRMPGVAFAAARSAIKENVAVLVQVPRRGYVPSLACAKCRTPARCRHCNGPLALPQSATGEAASPHCKWCGITEAAFRCQACGARALRATVIGAARTAEELGRAFAGVPIRTSGGGEVLDTVEPGAQVVVATVGAEPLVQGGY
ncbi:primosomal protein N', partial [Nocardia salmonicida]|uniref:primosomal protein N' family DNA-binding protein n=1 Tax=Nocardia salmonicida TaxID=53431 RepID=UPI003665DAF4